MADLDTDTLSARYRQAAVDVPGRRVLITRIAGSAQEPDLSVPVNCRGFGRIRHFRRDTAPGFPPNPLPIDPAARSLGLPASDVLRAQVFQSAVCNWRCWYCYVPFDLLAAHPKRSAWMGAGELVDLYLDQLDPPRVLDLSGGQPDLTPEWTVWIMEALRERGLERRVYLWSDDNLSNDYFWRFLTPSQRRTISEYPTYGRVCCFKGFDATSFAFNTKAAPDLFERQFELMGRLLALKLDLYAYATFPAPSSLGLEGKMHAFVDRLQRLDHYLPLRTVPLEIQVFGASAQRVGAAQKIAMDVQRAAVECWTEELERRFSARERTMSIVDVPLGRS